MTWHQTIIVGNLGRDPELRYMQNGRAVCNFSVAVSEVGAIVRPRNGARKPPGIAWPFGGAQAETCNTYLSSGGKSW